MKTEEKEKMRNNMYYIWTIASNFPNSCWLQYDWENNPEYLQFLENKKLNIDYDIKFYLQKKANKNTFLKFDYVMSDAIPLISKKLSDIIFEYASNDVQLIKAKVFQNDDFIENYYIPIALQLIDCIDKKKSIFDKEIDDFTKIVFKPNSLSNIIIAKVKGYGNNDFIVQEEFVKICNKEKIKGIEFFQEPYVNPLYLM
jgi:hypothetical protein